LFHSKITRRLVSSFLLIVLVSLSLLGIILLNYFRDYTMQQERNTLILNAKIVETAFEDILYTRNTATLDTMLRELHDKTNLRITIVDADGTVLGDTSEPSETMENHLAREEIQQALREDYGIAVRESATLHENFMYVAVPVYRNGQLIGIIRTSASLASMEQSYYTGLHVILSALFFALLAALIVAVWLAHRQVQPIRCLSLDAMEIAGGNLHKRLRWRSGDDEFDTLVKTINRLTANLSRKIQESQDEAHKMSLILNHTDNAIMLIDEQGLIVSTNRQAEEIFHLQGNELHRHSIHVIGSAELSETAQVVCHENKAQTITLQFDGKNGTVHTFQVFLGPFRDGPDELVLAVFHDISLLQEINQRQAEFVSNAAHELATPLTSISGFAETLLDDDFKDPEASHHFINIIYQEAQRMNRLMKGLLELARLDSRHGRTKVKRVPVSVNETLERTGRLLQDKAAGKSQTLQVEPSDENLLVSAAPELFNQIIYNLTENAVKYTPEGGTILVRSEKDGDKVKITVKDNGIGISPSDLPRIFDRFYRVDKARARKSGGNGIGLSLVKFLVELFGGKIEVQSALGEGTVFTLTFPCTAAE
jgi:two-component system, OmpR family, phosphate regulon sensor histidine kinase PhoR